MTKVKRKKKASRKVVKVKPKPFGDSEIEGKFNAQTSGEHMNISDKSFRDEPIIDKAIRVKRSLSKDGSGGSARSRAEQVKKGMGSEGPATQAMRAEDEYRPVTEEGKKIKKKVKRKKRK